MFWLWCDKIKCADRRHNRDVSEKFENHAYLILIGAYAILAIAKKILYPSGTQSENPGAPSPGFSLG